MLAGSSPSSLHPVLTASRQGFETQIAVPATPYVAVQALDATGKVLSTSSVAHPT